MGRVVSINRNNTKEFLHDNAELAGELEKKVHEKLGVGEQDEARPEAEKEADAAKAADAVKAVKKPVKKAA